MVVDTKYYSSFSDFWGYMQAAGGVTSSPMKYVCELCSRHGKIQDGPEQEKKFERNSDGYPRLEVSKISAEMQPLSGG